MKVVINTCHGGFGISKECVEFMVERGNACAIEELSNLQNKAANFFGYIFNNDRTNPDLIAAVEILGSKVASGYCSKLEVIEIPDDIDWEIEEYDGNEHIAESHRTWC